MDESSNASGREPESASSWVARPPATSGWVIGEVRPGRTPVLDALIAAGHGEGPDVDE